MYELSAASSLGDCELSKMSFSAVFIRAPAILSVGEDVTVLATLNAKPHASVSEDVKLAVSGSIRKNQNKSKKRKLNDDDSIEVVVAAQQNNILATAFHPELTSDSMWHLYFARMIIRFVDEGSVGLFEI